MTLQPQKKEYSKIVLMYSGGLDTSCMLTWLQEQYNAEIITFTADLGQEMADPKRFQEIADKAKNLGAIKTIVSDLKEEFAEEYLLPAIKANAWYQGAYPLSTALGRPLIAKKCVEIALEEGAEAIAHGSTGKGNDQIRIDVYAKALAPEIEMLRPMIEWGMGRKDELIYAEERGIPISSQNKKYSTDENMWGRSAECDILEQPEEIPPPDSLEWLKSYEEWPDEPEIVKIGFEQGKPVSINDEAMDLVKLIEVAHKLGIKHGVGWIEHMEDRGIGLKSRETYELPAASIIMPAHQELEKYVCNRHENSFKTSIDQKWTEMAYLGFWGDPLLDALNAFIDEVNKKVTGWVKVRLFKGKAQVVARESPYGLYDLNLATYDTSSRFNERASYGFIELWGLPTRIGYQIKQRVNEDLEKREFS